MAIRISTRLLMMSSAGFMAILGLAASFLPHEVLTRLGQAPAPVTVATVQIAGALWFGFAILNWSAKGSPLGGIYGRPIVLANFTHFVIAAIALSKASLGAAAAPTSVVTILYVVFAAWFGLVLFGPGPSAP
jgi:hypothetical protein